MSDSNQCGAERMCFNQTDYRLRKRKEFEDLIRRENKNVQIFVKYANWEASQNDFTRARSVWERALEAHYRNHTLWFKYADFEMKNKFINGARNVWDRATLLLPRVDQLWFKYVHMEEMLGNVGLARGVFERWMSWEPDENAWLSYVKFELRYNEIDLARVVFERFVKCRPKAGAWIRYAEFEVNNGEIGRARDCYERAVDKLADDDEDGESLFVAFAEFEEKCKEIERARLIYKYALDHIPKGRVDDLYRKFVAFEKQYGDREGIEDAIVGIGKAPKDKLFKKYIEIELQLGNIDRCRKLYEQYLKWSPENCYAWSMYAELERSLSEKDRARSIFELAIAQPALDMPELLWKAYIDFEISEGEFRSTRRLYERLLERTKHVKVWISLAKFESSAMLEEQEPLRIQCLQNARRVFESAINYFREYNPDLKEERTMLLKEWLNLETSFGKLGDESLVLVKMPKKLKRRRLKDTDDGHGYEEYIDYTFPEETQSLNMKILEAAYRWKKQKTCSC